MKTWHLHIKGQVQGVGFRPHVFRIAKQFNLMGWVNNSLDGVHVRFNASKRQAQAFYTELIHKTPRLAQITSWKLFEVDSELFPDFSIQHSNLNGKPNLLLSPDFALCEVCRSELYQSSKRRESYFFNTCTLCGPRFSIVHKLPYDRIHTSMETFPMCANCSAEYDDPADRRYYSQTNTCNQCAVPIQLFDNKQILISENHNEIIDMIIESWTTDKIIALKGIGGYLLTCDATSPTVIQALRVKKHRPHKPFAVMVPTAISKTLSELDQNVKGEFTRPSAPIILIQKTYFQTCLRILHQVCRVLESCSPMPHSSKFF